MAAERSSEFAKELSEEELKALVEKSEDFNAVQPSPSPNNVPFDDATKKMVARIPLLSVKAGPRDQAKWVDRLKEEYRALIQYVKMNKEADNDWFHIESNKNGTRWAGKCWTFLDGLQYEFALEFEIPATYPTTNPDLCLPELEGKTAKMYRGGKICLTIHFQPLWLRNAPRFGIAHALALGLAPWLAAEVPDLVQRGVIVHQ